MERHDVCRACNINMRVAGTYSHCSVLFERRSKPQSVAERLQKIGLTVTPDTKKSDRICPRCVTTLTRLERDLPIFREWEREFSGATGASSEAPTGASSEAPTVASSEAPTGASSEAPTEKRAREPTPSKTPRKIKKGRGATPSSSGTSPGGLVSSRKSITQVRFPLPVICA